MRKHRADDDDLVVVEDELVDLDRHVHREQAVGEFADFVGGERADFLERGGIVPLVIEEANLAELGRAVRSAEISSRSQMASSLIGGCVPSAVRTSSSLVTAPIWLKMDLNNNPTGAVRV